MSIQSTYLHMINNIYSLSSPGPVNASLNTLQLKRWQYIGVVYNYNYYGQGYIFNLIFRLYNSIGFRFGVIQKIRYKIGGREGVLQFNAECHGVGWRGPTIKQVTNQSISFFIINNVLTFCSLQKCYH